jgi:hypothetical protein
MAHLIAASALPKNFATVIPHTPVHASRLNHIELYFSIVQRKVLTPNDHANLKQLERRITAPVSATPPLASRSPGHSPARTCSAACTIRSYTKSPSTA